jgi:hypothetical protein
MSILSFVRPIPTTSKVVPAGGLGGAEEPAKNFPSSFLQLGPWGAEEPSKDFPSAFISLQN